MGIGIGFSRSSYDDDYGGILSRKSRSSYDIPTTEKKVELPNPDPTNYKVMKAKLVGYFLIVMVNYPDCKNYEGDKILIYENTTLDDLHIQGHLDPHFSENLKFRSPIARFYPTERGWNMAIDFCESQLKDE